MPENFHAQLPYDEGSRISDGLVAIQRSRETDGHPKATPSYPSQPGSALALLKMATM
jgi:hypothetical protein